MGKIPPINRDRAEEKARYLFAAHNEEWMRNKGELQAPNEMGGRPVEHIVARNSGLHAKTRPQKPLAD